MTLIETLKSKLSTIDQEKAAQHVSCTMIRDCPISISNSLFLTYDGSLVVHALTNLNPRQDNRYVKFSLVLVITKQALIYHYATHIT